MSDKFTSYKKRGKTKPGAEQQLKYAQTPKTKQELTNIQLRAKIVADIDEFFKRGGKIEKIPTNLGD
jgi:flagellar basal body-associated protein FliL